jgi:ATP-dependent Clp protease adaptor protein ClpS
MSETITKTRATNKIKIQEPSKYKVVVYNDDKTPVDFVVAMLIKVFRHSESIALDLTMKIHNDGYAVAGIYPFEIAEQKGVEATGLARQYGHPLLIKVETE